MHAMILLDDATPKPDGILGKLPRPRRPPHSVCRFLATVSFVKPRYRLLFAGTGADVASRATAFARPGIKLNEVGLWAADLTVQLEAAPR